MTKICYVNTGKLLQFKVREFEEDDEEDYYEGDINVKVVEDGKVVTYSFSDPEVLDNFLLILEENSINYEIFDDDGNLVEWMNEEDYDNIGYDD